MPIIIQLSEMTHGDKEKIFMKMKKIDLVRYFIELNEHLSSILVTQNTTTGEVIEMKF